MNLAIYRESALAYARRALGNWHDAEEAYQQACIAVLGNPSGSFMAIVRKACRDLKRGKQAEPSMATHLTLSATSVQIRHHD